MIADPPAQPAPPEDRIDRLRRQLREASDADLATGDDEVIPESVIARIRDRGRSRIH